MINSLLHSDRRHEEQIARDKELLKHYCEYSYNNHTHIDIHTIGNNNYAPLENKHVFPFSISKGNSQWNDALKHIVDNLNIKIENTFGIDINTG